MAQQNYLNMPRIDQQRQSVQINAVNMSNNQEDRALAKDAMSEQQRLENTRWMAEIGKYGQEQMSQDPNAYLKLMPMIEQEGKRRGVWEKIGIDYTTASPEAIMQGFQAMEQAGITGLGGVGQEDPKLVKDAAGYQRHAGGSQFGERAFPDVEKPEGGTGQPSRQQWEYETIRQQAIDAGGEPPSYEEWLSDDPRRQSSADMQAYNSYLGSFKGSEQPMSEQEYASTRAGEIAGSKTTGAGTAQRQLDLPTAWAQRDQSSQNMQRLYDATTELVGNEKLWKAVGIYQTMALIPGQEGADIRADIKNIKSQVGFMVLQDMRNASKTGGALGQVSEKENELLQDNLASLDVNQSPEHFRKNLQIIQDYLRKAQFRIKNAWRLTYPKLDQYGNQKVEPGQMTPAPENDAPTATGPNGEKLVLRNGQWVQQ